MGPGGNTTTNSNNYNFNRYKEGGIGASTIANRNVKNRLASFCKTGCAVVTPPCIPVAIDIASIATDAGESTYTLNGNYTITECQILNIPLGTTLQINAGQTLTNMGTINNTGTIQNSGTIQNNIGVYIYNSGTFNNNGTFNNSGTINNNGTIENYSGAIVNNIGTIYNNTDGIIFNNGFIYTYGGGEIDNHLGATFNNDAFGTISTANGLSICGTGTFGGDGTFNNIGTINTNCP